MYALISMIFLVVSVYHLSFVGCRIHPLPGNRVLVFSPHPDDDILGCGGSLMVHVSKGAKVTIIYMTSGEAGR